MDHDPLAPEDDPYDHFVTASPKLRRGRRRRRTHGVVRFALGIGVVLVTFALVVGGAGFFYLGQGQISLESLQPAIAASLQSRLGPGFKVALGPTAISRGSHGVGIGFSGLAIRDPQGRLVVDAPGGRIGLDAFALLRADVKVRRLELDGLQLSLRVGPKGELSLSAGDDKTAAIAPIPLGPPPTATAPQNLGDVVATLAEAMAGVDQPLDHVAILGGKLAVQTAGRETPTIYDNLRLTFDRSGAAATASLAAHGPSGDWSVTARAEAGSDRSLAVEAKDLAADDFLRLVPQPPKFSFDPPISFEFAAKASPGGALTGLTGSFSLGAGSFDPHDPDNSPAIAIDEATGNVSLDAQGRYALDKLEVLAGATHVRIGGWLAPPLASDAQWRLHLHSADALFAGAPDQPAAKLDNVDLDAHFDRAAATLETDKFTLSGPHLNGEMGVRLHFAADGPELKMDISGAGSLLEALRLWPVFVNADARKWCVENVKGGELATGSLKVDWDAAALALVLAKQAPPAESVDGHFTLRDTAVDLLPGLPTTTGVDATGIITGRHFQVAAARGTMDLGNGRRLVGSDLSFTVPDTKPVDRMPAEGGAHVTGSADSLADLLSRPALKRYVGVDLDPPSIKGQFQGDLKLNLTLGKGVQPEEQKFRVNGALAGLSVDKFLGPVKLEQGALDIVADGSQVKMTGTGQVFGSLAKLELTKAGQDVGALVLTGVLDDSARAKLGFNSGPRLKGPVGLKLKAKLDKSGADAEVDLTRASLDSLGGPAWKPAGRPGKATFELKPVADAVQVNNIAVDAGALSARGTALFGADGALKTLKLAPLRMSAADDLKLDLTGGAPAKVSLRGSALDARAMLKGLTSGGADHDSSDLDLDVKVAAALGNNKEKITGFEMSATRRNGTFATLDARGRLGRSVLTAHTGDGGLLSVKSDDAGALARFLDVYAKMDGGTIDLSVHSNGDSARGQATIKRFGIRDEPSLQKLEESAPAQQNAARGGGVMGSGDPAAPVRFDKLTANFTRTGGNLEVRDGVIANASFGLTMQGFIDFSKDKLDLNGVYVPLYGVNNALNGIPVLGTLLTGGTNEGVFAINYRVSGAASGPTLTINPLSPLTPGFLRKMFGAIDGTSPSPSSDSPASSYAPTP